ncbi:SWIB/MDM2 domain-containing protein [Sinimarinibacterium thermocellulolyticum]|uniref:SWIB/MDM2 domain-containing protein n=1 Tax=Sinimarinibacterium TaxID=1861863 RepID=UPI003DA000D2
MISEALVKAKKAAAKKAPVKKAVKKAAPKKAAKKSVRKTKRKASPALMKPMTPSATLAAVVGSKPIPRGQITKNLWAYIKKNGLQDKTNRRQINADDKLKAIFGGKSSVSMFEMTKLVSKHIS